MVALEAVALSGGVAGVLDLSATGALTRAQGVPLRRLLQGIASGALGKGAFEGGAKTAAAGVGFHFLIAWIWAGIYWMARASQPVLVERPWLCGAVYGVVVHLAMSRVVLPLSRMPKRPFVWKAFLTQLVIHVVCVGLPIALVQRWAR